MAEYGDDRSNSLRQGVLSLLLCDAIYRRVLLFVCSMNHILPYLFLSREHDDDVRDIGKHDIRSVLFHPNCYLMLLDQWIETNFH